MATFLFSESLFHHERRGLTNIGYAKRIFLFTLLVVLSGTLIPNATPAEALEGKILLPAADSYVWSEYPDWNRGKEWDLIVQVNVVERIVFLMFDLGEIPNGASIHVSDLHLFTNDVDLKALVSTHYCPSNSWTEEGITYSNRPSFSENPTDAVNVTQQTTWYIWNVTDATQTALVNSDKKLTLVVEADNHGGIVFRSKDDPWAAPPYLETRPYLDISYLAPPSSGNDPSLPIVIAIAVITATIIGLELAYILKHRQSRKTTQPVNTRLSLSDA